MTDKELLKQHTDLIVEIKDLECEIKILEKKESKVERDIVTGSNPYFPFEMKHFNIEGYNIVEEEDRNCKISKKKDILVKRKNKCEELKIQIEEFISTIPDSLTRRVFRYRYVDNLGWQAIAMRIGKAHESYPRRDIHDKYLDNL